MVWLCENLKEASKVKGNHVKRWKIKDHFSEIFCAKNYNKDSRYITIIKIQGRGRSIIIVQEAEFNSGWSDIAAKIERFINGGVRRNTISAPKVIEEGLLYSNTVRNHKWASRGMKEAEVQQEGEIIHISGDLTHNALLDRCLVGFFPEESSEIAILLEVCKWSANLWKQAHGINIYEMQYADDTLVFCEADREQLKVLRVIFILFEVTSGLRINWYKSFIYPVNEVMELQSLADILGGKVGQLPTVYLGMPSGAKSKSKGIWNSVLEKCEKKLANWKNQYLSMGAD